MPIGIMLVDDHQILREGLRMLLEKELDMRVVAEAENGREAVDLVAKSNPDVIVMDIVMPVMNGLEAATIITERYRDIRIVALSMYADRRYVMNMLQAGARGFLLKDCASRELVTAVRTVMGGSPYLGPSVSDIVAEEYVNSIQGSGAEEAEKKLTDREMEVLRLVAEGNSIREIAKILNISAKTVEAHKHNFMKKLDLQGIVDLMKYAIREGIVSLDA